uniref:Cyclin dependent kinase 2 interacting protein n=1 Tax=Ornithorhynchus anatinus TaxID=9258 RepID=A0A6I8NGZ3_ORNAN
MADGGVAVLEVHIPSVGPEAEGPDRTLEKGHMVFRVEIFYNGRRHTIQRRYSEFHALHKRGVLYLNQEIPKELLEFLKLRHFPSDTKASSLDSLGEFLPGNSSCQLHHRPVLNFNKDPYVDPPSSANNLGIVTPKRPVLSVSARKIKDNAADWHNLIKKWETLNDAGFTVANKIVNTRIGALTKDPKMELEGSHEISSSDQTLPEFNKELDSLCKELHGALESMVKIQLKMEKLTSTTKGICDLETYHHRVGKCPVPLFHTWPTTYFYEVSLKLSEMYKKELRLKRTVVEALAHTRERDPMMTYLSIWLHQPYLDESSKAHLESMLYETGHRP